MKYIIAIFIGCLVLTINLKSQWERVQSIPPPYDKSYWLEIYFLPQNPNYGWVCGYDGRVIRTTDGGKTWQGTTIPTAYQLEHIQFANEKIGYTSGQDIFAMGRIYKTTDGGAFWFDITPPDAEELWGHFFLDENYGMVIGGGCISHQRFFGTTDGGQSWSFIFDANLPNSGLTDLILYSRNGLGYASSSGYIWKTTDGGQSWQIFSRTGDNDWQEDLFISGNTILVPYSTGCGGGGGSGGARISTDFGKTWKEFSTGTSMFGAFLLDSLRGWVCGWNRAIYYTSNGGESWELLNCGLTPKDSLDDFWFVNDTTGWVVGTGVFRWVGRKKIQAQIEAIPNANACEGDTITLRALNDTKFFHWSTNQTTREIKITKPGIYELYAWDTECDSITPAKISVNFNPKPKITLSPSEQIKLCEGDTIQISLSTNGNRYRWNTGEQTPTIAITKPGRYIAYSVFESTGCIDSAFVDVILAPNPKPKIETKGRMSICKGDSVILFLNGNYKGIEWFMANNPEKPIGQGQTFIAKDSGHYFARVETIDGCRNVSDTVLIDVRLDSNALEVILASSGNTINFDKVKVRELQCLDMELKNHSDNDLTIDYLMFLRNVSFSTSPSLFPLTIPARGSRKIPVCYFPHQLGIERDTIVVSDRCWDHYVYLIAQGAEESYVGVSNCDVEISGKTYVFLDNGKIWISEPFPIPSINFVNFKIELDSIRLDDINFNIFNSYGEVLDRTKIVVNGKGNTYSIQIDVSGLPAGVYFLVSEFVRVKFVHKFPIVIIR